MNRTKLLGMGFAAAAMVALAGAALAGLSTPFGNASAAGGPPAIGMVAYGEAPGATPGQKIYATVTANGVSTTCGQGLVVDDGGPKYVVTVVADDQTAGCGLAGRTVGFYIGAASSTQGPRMAITKTTWEAAKGKQVNLTFGAPLTVRARAAFVAKAP
ncbi:MAG: hypothetical protein HY875_15650 [Chloroflexi bacterium]|nr:hypothetical protein [Chloroflexota bacterium]